MLFVNAITLFVADADRKHIQKTREALAGRQDLAFMGSCGHGQMAFRRLMAESADILLLDLQLPGIDGMALMRALNRQNRCPVCIVCTRFYSDVIVACSAQSGANYVLYKPLDYEALPDILIRCCRHFRPDLFSDPHPPPRPPARVHALTALGFHAGQRGMWYLREALNLLRERPELLRNLSKELYPAIARKINTSPACVEHSLRHAISTAWECGPLMKVFPRRPTNREFLTYIHDLNLNSDLLPETTEF